jgi:hypothetical protein
MVSFVVVCDNRFCMLVCKQDRNFKSVTVVTEKTHQSVLFLVEKPTKALFLLVL